MLNLVVRPHKKFRYLSVGQNLSVALLEEGNKWLESRSPYFVIAAANLALGDTNFYPKSFLDKNNSRIHEPGELVAVSSTSANAARWFGEIDL